MGLNCLSVVPAGIEPATQGFSVSFCSFITSEFMRQIREGTPGPKKVHTKNTHQAIFPILAWLQNIKVFQIAT